MKWGILRLGLSIYLLGLAVLMLAGCLPATAQTQELRVGGRLDVLPLMEEVRPRFESSTGISLTVRPTDASIQDLRAGKLDVVVLGRDPSVAELTGLVDHVVALDAICVVVDVRSYVGGVQADLSFHPKLLRAKTEGLRGLTLDEVRYLFGNRIRGSGPVWQWEGMNFKFQNTGTGVDKVSEDPKNPGYAVGKWVKAPVYLIPDLWRPNKVDTQSALFGVLGLPEGDTVSAGNNLFLPRFLESEEELVSFRYSKGPAPAPIGSEQFGYQMAVLSRRVTIKAIEHGFRLRALAIDGIDPVQDPAVIYDGTYPMPRKIHLLTRTNASPDASALAALLLSPEGQQAVAASGFLPLAPAR